MCNHLFNFPDDIPENYNSDKVTLTGICRLCGKRQESYGIRWAMRVEERFRADEPYGETMFDYLDKRVEIC